MGGESFDAAAASLGVTKEGRALTTVLMASPKRPPTEAAASPFLGQQVYARQCRGKLPAKADEKSERVQWEEGGGRGVSESLCSGRFYGWLLEEKDRDAFDVLAVC